jgi:hypothetical protein
MTDPYADFTARDSDGAELSIVWVKGGGARITIAGDQPLNQPPCSILRSCDEMIALRDYLNAQRLSAARLYKSTKGIWYVEFNRNGQLLYSSLRTRDEAKARRWYIEWQRDNAAP